MLESHPKSRTLCSKGRLEIRPKSRTLCSKGRLEIRPKSRTLCSEGRLESRSKPRTLSSKGRLENRPIHGRSSTMAFQHMGVPVVSPLGVPEPKFGQEFGSHLKLLLKNSNSISTNTNQQLKSQRFLCNKMFQTK